MGYSLESLHRGIRACEVNIATFEDAIKQERQTMAEYRWMIEQIERKAEEKDLAERAKIAVDASIQAQNNALIADAKRQGKRVVTVQEQDDGDSSELL